MNLKKNLIEKKIIDVNIIENCTIKMSKRDLIASEVLSLYKLRDCILEDSNESQNSFSDFISELDKINPNAKLRFVNISGGISKRYFLVNDSLNYDFIELKINLRNNE